MTSCQSTRKCSKDQKRYKASRIKERKIREDIDRKEERFRLLSDKVDKYRMVDAELEAELQQLQAGEERRGSNASQTGNCCMEEAWQQFLDKRCKKKRDHFWGGCQEE